MWMPAAAQRNTSSSQPTLEEAMLVGHGDRWVIGSYTDYADAERAVDYLADRGFPVERVAIIGHDLRLVEQVLGRFGYRQAILRGAGSGALVGVLIGWIF